MSAILTSIVRPMECRIMEVHYTHTDKNKAVKSAPKQSENRSWIKEIRKGHQKVEGSKAANSRGQQSSKQ